MHNLIDKPEASTIQSVLDALLKRRLTSAHDDFLPSERYIAKWNYRVDATGTLPTRP
jgi:hypothetical protein